MFTTDKSNRKQSGFTPNFVVFGREVRQPLDILLGLGRVNSREHETSEYLQHLKSVLEEVHKIASENLRRVQLRQNKDYDININEHQFEVGDVVLKVDCY